MRAVEVGAAPHLKVAAVQMRSTRILAENLAHITNSIRECARQGDRVVVFPESALSSYFGDVVTNLSAAQLAQAEQQVAERPAATQGPTRSSAAPGARRASCLIRP